jgi:NADP-dependent 3-hydroxy acid dehydrogenase YdfG
MSKSGNAKEKYPLFVIKGENGYVICIISVTYSRIAIVTGATSGIGEATARKFIAAGFGVAGNGRRAEKLNALEKELDPAFCGVAGDAADNAVPERLFESAYVRFGRQADIVVASAGRGLGGSVKDADLAQFEEVIRINLTGAPALLQKAAQNMVDGQQAALVRLLCPAALLPGTNGFRRRDLPGPAAFEGGQYWLFILG